MLSNLVNTVKTLQDQFSKFQHKLPQDPTLMADPDDIIREVDERSRRSKNIILYNVSETDGMMSSDHDVVSNLIKSLPTTAPIDLAEVKVFRLGSVNAKNLQKPRPLKVILKNKTDVIDILKNSKHFSNDVKASSDKTIMQRQQWLKLKQQLQALEEKGDNTKTIKYIKGVPKIVGKN